jgi:hypothetical protein
VSAWFDSCNARQIIEAGVKETNVVFKMHPLRMRSKGGIGLQEQFAVFTANFALDSSVVAPTDSPQHFSFRCGTDASESDGTCGSRHQRLGDRRR